MKQLRVVQRTQILKKILWELKKYFLKPVLITASEDGTAKLWDLNSSSVGSKTGGGGGNYDDGSGKGFPSTGIADIEPLYTFRGHR